MKQIFQTYDGYLAITMESQFYQTTWFRILAEVALMAIIAGFFGFRMRQLKQRQLALARTNAELDQRVQESAAELARFNEELARRESMFRLLFEHAPIGIWWRRTDLGATCHFNAAFRRLLDLPAENAPDDSVIAERIHPDDAAKRSEMERLVRSGQTDSYSLELRFIRQDGRQVWGLLSAAVVREARGQVAQVVGLLEDITGRKAAEEDLAKTRQRLADAAQVAGMAEIATGVLHNVGNVLNSVNVSASMLVDGLRQSRLGSVGKISGLLHAHAANLAEFLTQDPRGQRILPYLDTLADHLSAEQRKFIEEVETLRGNVEHIKEIVARQQSYAQLSGLLEKLSPPELMEDALRMNGLALVRHGIEVVREFAPAPQVIAERHKVLQILINLIQNAKQALKASHAEKKRLCVRIVPNDQTVRFEVIDNGVGIPPQNLSQIFEHGFTTRANGHGFGLHSSANAAREMQGSLTVQSEGSGRGATFILELPIAQEAVLAPH